MSPRCFFDRSPHQSARPRQRALSLVAASAVGAMLLASACGISFGSKVGQTGQAGQGGQAAQATPANVQTFEVRAVDHVNGPVEYPQTPPVGGPHALRWWNCGFYSEPVVTEAAVHSMEHGAVWITYRPDLAQDQVAALRRLAQGRRYVLISPFPGLNTAVVASAWGKQARYTSATDPGLTAFVRAFEAGPQTPEPGAPCAGGLGQPS